ncbi:MAG: UDP-N-acetylmuramoyl-L-alanine--D-glutamate ligase [Proteobacteria bacterium]|nr:UDP-N-acetylmuramoyl-L-alanine--D-glutamate ligase [Pseudomonadota bacterium]MBU1611421.1 UDP-N-acetylmuramoyl-L-alanine--D-glutamate ligase [Pseudomonadota bacterium]
MNALIKEFRDLNLLDDHLGVVVGAGASGIAAARLLAELGAQVRVVDTNTKVDPSVVAAIGFDVDLQLGPHSRVQFDDADIVVLSPGVPVKKMTDVLTGVPARKIVAELELASWFTVAPVLAVTGTNGKTTTTTLISHILEHAGKKVFTGGNIGTPLCQYLLDSEPADVLVLEVSSFQLQNVRLFRPHVGLLLNFSANHLDYHVDMEEYLQAKLNLFAQQDEQDTAILPLWMKQELEERNIGNGTRLYFEPQDLFEAPHLPGAHNRANITAAWLAVREFGVTEAQAAEAIRVFKPLSHRQEPVAEKNGVLFVDDSKATNLDAVIAAVQSFDRPVRLLLGGVFKGGDVATLLPACLGRVVQVGLFGAGRDTFEGPLKTKFDLFWEDNLEKAVGRLAADAKPGDVVLLSPATASFDAYKSYADRGDHFRRIVEDL